MELTPNDLHFVVSRLPKDIVKLMKETKIIVAGGFIRETLSRGDVKDIDLFGASKDQLKSAAQSLALDRKGRMFETQNAFTVLSPPRLAVQFITRWLFDEGKACIDSFDFTVCQACVWFGEDNKWHSLIADNFYSDLACRRLVYTFPARDEDAGGSTMRMKKFLTRGYTVQAACIAGVMARIFTKIRSKESYRDNGDNEQWIAKVITGLLREVDPLTVIDGIDLVDEHEVVKEIQLESGESQDEEFGL